MMRVAGSGERRLPTQWAGRGDACVCRDDTALTTARHARLVPDRSMLVSTILTAAEQRRVDAIGADRYDVVHRASVDQVMEDVRSRWARGVIISVARCHSADTASLEGTVARIVRDFPHVATIALLSEATAAAAPALLLLGRSGIRTVADTRWPEGWRTLRDALETRAAALDIAVAAAAQLAADLHDASTDCRRFFLTLFAMEHHVGRVRELARLLAVVPSTLISRFARSALPSPKTYLAWARLVRAAALLEQPGVSIAAMVAALDYSSPQAFTRHLRLFLGLTPPTFRESYRGRTMFDRFRQELVLPHLATLNRFRPLVGSGAGGPGSAFGVSDSGERSAEYRRTTAGVALAGRCPYPEPGP